MNINRFKFKDLSIVHISNSKLKHSYLSVSKELEIVVKTPKVALDYVMELIKKKESWILKKLFDINSRKIIKVKLQEEVLLFGEVYNINSLDVQSLKKLLDNMKVESKENIIKKYNLFYKNCANDYIIPRVAYFSKIMNLEYNEIKFRKMKSRWGSCSSERNLTFNTELMKIKKELIDYVIVHELAHLSHMNHSKKFHKLVDKYLPLSKECKKELNSIGRSIF